MKGEVMLIVSETQSADIDGALARALDDAREDRKTAERLEFAGANGCESVR